MTRILHLLLLAALAATSWAADRSPLVMGSDGRPTSLPAGDRIHLPNAAGTFRTVIAAPATAARTITLPDATTTLGGLSVAQTWTAAQTFGANVTISGTNTLTVASDADTVHTFGRAKIGYNGTDSDNAIFAHFDQTAQAAAALRQNASGTTILGAPTGQTIIARINNTAVLTVAGSSVTIAQPTTFSSGLVTVASHLAVGAGASAGASSGIWLSRSAGNEMFIAFQENGTGRAMIRSTVTTDGLKFTNGDATVTWAQVSGAALGSTTLTINGTTASTSTTSGALVVTGGVGVGGALTVASGLTVTAGNVVVSRAGDTTVEIKTSNVGSGREIIFADATAGTKLNWKIGAQINVDQTFEITPSTTAAGSTYTTPSAAFDASTTATHTRFLIYDVDNGTLERVTVGAADSAGVGYKVLRIPN